MEETYFSKLLECSQIFNKNPRIQFHQRPNIGDVVQIKDSTPEGTRKSGRMIKMIKGGEGVF